MSGFLKVMKINLIELKYVNNNNEHIVTNKKHLYELIKDKTINSKALFMMIITKI